MKSPMILGDAVHLDEHVELFYKSSPTDHGVTRIRYAIFNTFGTDLSYIYDTNKLAGIANFNYFSNWFENIKPIRLLTNVQWGVSYNAVTMTYSANISVYNPVHKSPIPIASWEIFFSSEINEAGVRSYIVLFNAHYFEQMCHHLQMVLVNYEKLYYVIDVYTELLINKDKYMPYHMTNVANWCMLLSTELNLDSKDQMVLYISALIHDIGKMYIPDEILNKNAKLTDEEYNRMKMHPIKGHQMAQASLFGMTFFMDVPNIIKHHHERFDGTGYPNRLQATKIPFLSRIISVADTVDAMMSRRAYKDRESTDKIIEELVRCSGTQFDPIIVDKMIHILMDMKIGSPEASVSDTHFVPQAALSFYYKDVHHILSLSGNLIIQENTGKLLVHSEIASLDEMVPELMYRATLSFYKMTDLLEYNVEIEGIMHDQVYLKNFALIPTDKYFSIVWDGSAVFEHKSFGMHYVQLVKVGGDSLVFEADSAAANDLIKYRGEILKLNMSLEVDSYKLYFELDCKINKFYHFGTKTTFIAKFINISTAERDKLLRLLFKRQVSLKQHRHAAAKGGNK